MQQINISHIVLTSVALPRNYLEKRVRLFDRRKRPNIDAALRTALDGKQGCNNTNRNGGAAAGNHNQHLPPGGNPQRRWR
jgi:hypothetical protein